MASPRDSGDDKNTEKLLLQQKSEDQQKGTDWQHYFKNLRGVTVCLASGLFKGLVPVTSRYVQDRGYTAYQMLLLSDALILLVVLITIVYNRTDIRPTGLNQGVRLVFQGVARLSGWICVLMSYRCIPPAQAETIFDASCPVFTLMLSCIFLQEMPTHATLFGSMWCTAGVVLLGYGSFVAKLPSADNRDVLLGIVLSVVGSFLMSTLGVGAKILLEYTPKATVVTYTYAVTTMCAGIAAAFTSSSWRLDPLAATVLASNCVTHGLGIFFYYVGLKLVEVNAVTALLQFRIFIAYVLQWAILGMAPTIFDALGLTCVIIGTFSVVIWEVIVRWKDEKYRTFMKELDFNATSPKDGQ